MPRIANPYGVQTPIGQGLRALSTMALTRRDNADKQALYDYQADMYGAHSALYDAQRRKTDAELAALDANARARSPEALDEAVAAVARLERLNRRRVRRSFERRFSAEVMARNYLQLYWRLYRDAQASRGRPAAPTH